VGPVKDLNKFENSKFNLNLTYPIRAFPSSKKLKSNMAVKVLS
jgi:hypothetical protein